MSGKNGPLARIRFYFKNMPHMAENTFLITAAFSVPGVNCILAGIFSSLSKDERIRKGLILLGILLIGIALTAKTDPRPEMKGTGYTLCCVVFYWMMGFAFFFLISRLWILIFLLEFLFVCGVILFGVCRKTG